MYPFGSRFDFGLVLFFGSRDIGSASIIDRIQTRTEPHFRFGLVLPLRINVSFLVGLINPIKCDPYNILCEENNIFFCKLLATNICHYIERTICLIV